MAGVIPEEYYYTKDHEWAQVDENIVTVGITVFAQDQLGEVVYVDLPEEGQKVTPPRNPYRTCPPDQRPQDQRAPLVAGVKA